MLSRADALEAMTADRFDVVVIGGGVTGAGVALDAASRGYSVALVERDDYAVGTSSRSSKMVHGGLRYLQNFDLGLVREALLERQLMVQLAPHLVYPTPFLIPTLGEARTDRRYGVGLNMYDVMATTRVGRSRRERQAREQAEDYWAPDRHRTIPGEEVLELLPALAAREPRSAYMFYDCQTDDVRLVLTILGEAERFGAVFVNDAVVTGLLEEGGKADGVAVTDAASGAEFEVRADNVVNATGVWADRIKPEEVVDEEDVPRISPSRGTHVTLALEDLPVSHAACIVPAGEGRTIFALPWYGRALVGTTDNDYEGDISHVEPSSDDIDYLLDAVNEYFEVDLDRSKLTGAYAGVRPLIATGDPRKSVDISRKAELYETSSGMLTITGGKLTTWRRMAKQVVDRHRRARGPRRAEPYRGHPARDAGGRGRSRPPRGPHRGRPSRGRPRAAALPLRLRRAQRAQGRRRAPRAGRPDRRRPPRHARRGRDRRPPRAGAKRRRRPATPHAPRHPRRAAAARRRVRHAGRRGDGRGAGLGQAPRQARGRGLGRRGPRRRC